LILTSISVLEVSCNGGKKNASETATTTIAAPDPDAPKVIPFEIVKEYPHDNHAFTEGIEFHDGFLWESTGEYGISDIRKVDLATGKVLMQTKMESKYFGEGMTLLNGKIYQLTYREGKGFVYDPKTLKQSGGFTFTAEEGWGMTNNGAQFIYDDGSNILHYIDPATYKEVKTLKVTDEHGSVADINELEMIHGFIYANQWQTDLILKIDTSTGKVVGRADLASLRQRAGLPQPTGRHGEPDVLNGIAYDATNNKIYVTGKNWPKLFEIKLDN